MRRENLPKLVLDIVIRLGGVVRDIGKRDAFGGKNPWPHRDILAFKANDFYVQRGRVWGEVDIRLNVQNSGDLLVGLRKVCPGRKRHEKFLREAIPNYSVRSDKDVRCSRTLVDSLEKISADFRLVFPEGTGSSTVLDVRTGFSIFLG